MRVLKVVAEGITTSFRYPHFMQGIHPTYEMPPPATIYGHVCSALGEWVAPQGVAFAYHFTAQGRVDDVEHIHVVGASSGRLPGTKIPKVLEGAINPFKRTLLFQPCLTLYINRPEWVEAFRSPRYAVVLGRSQDLFSYTDVRVVDLVQSDMAYFEHTLLPYDMAVRTRSGVVGLMPRYLDPQRNRTPSFAQYVVLQRRVHTSELWNYGGQETSYWVDPETPLDKLAHRGLMFHHFVEDTDETSTVA